MSAYANYQIEYIIAHLASYTQRDLHDMYESMLEETSSVMICGIKYSASDALKAVDPVLYRIGYNDYLDSYLEIGGEYYDDSEVSDLLEKFEEEEV